MRVGQAWSRSPESASPGEPASVVVTQGLPGGSRTRVTGSSQPREHLLGVSDHPPHGPASLTEMSRNPERQGLASYLPDEDPDAQRS